MAYKDFFIYSDRNKYRAPSTIEYRVEKLLKPRELKPHIKGELFTAIFGMITYLLVQFFQRVTKN